MGTTATIQYTRGSDVGGKRVADLTEAELAGTACLGCGQSDPPPTTPIGWYDGHEVRIHSACVHRWRARPRA